jgi:hypothetical protein
VVTELSGPCVAFDLEGLESVGHVDGARSIQDQSITPSNGDFNLRVKQGTLRQLLSAANDPEGKILNALSCPMPTLQSPRPHYSSDIRAFCSTMWRCEFIGDELPIPHISWGLVAIECASHMWHWDSDGFGTNIEIQRGSFKSLFDHVDVANI